MTRHSHSYRTTRKARNTGQWWKPKQQRIAERKSVRQHFAHWTAEAHSANRDAGIPHPDRLPHIFMRHINSWGAGPTLKRPITVYA